MQALSFWDGIGSSHSTDYPSRNQVNRPGSEIPQHEGDIPTSILELCVHPHDVQPIWEVCFVIRVGCLRHDIQSVTHHHRP